MINLKKLKGFHWNIHQSAGYKRNIVPDIVIEGIKRVMPDFGCITEYSKEAANKNQFEKALEDLNYNTYCTDAPRGQNDVLVFVDKKYESSKVLEFICSDNNDLPNYLEVLVKGSEFSLTVVATRIRVFNYEDIEQDRRFRIEQMLHLNKRLEKISTPCVVLGDFNARERWMQQFITADNYYLCKTNGHTYNFDNNSAILDHAVVKVVKAKIHTSWSFVKNLPEIYTDGPFSVNIPSPYPDHAQLICDVVIMEQKSSDSFF